MASTTSSNLNLGLRCGANRDGFSNRLGQGPCSLATKSNDAVWRGIRRRGRISMSMTTALEAKTGSKKVETINNSENGKLGHEKLDEWMTRSVVEIVRNLRSAPLMVQVHAENNSSKMWLETEKAEEEKWGTVKRKWEKGEAPMPNGLILVEELGEVERNIESERVWGIVVQGRKEECGGGPLCYLLKTTSVASGLGMCCTHFCLVQVKGFRESAESQLKNSWLVQAAFSP